MENAPVTTDAFIALEGYARGFSLVDISSRIGVSVTEVKKILNHYPDKFEDAKLKALELSNAKKRRIANIADDLKLEYLETLQNDNHIEAITKEIKNISSISDSADKQVLLADGRATDIVHNKSVEVVSWNDITQEKSTDSVEVESEVVVDTPPEQPQGITSEYTLVDEAGEASDDS